MRNFSEENNILLVSIENSYQVYCIDMSRGRDLVQRSCLWLWPTSQQILRVGLHVTIVKSRKHSYLAMKLIQNSPHYSVKTHGSIPL